MPAMSRLKNITPFIVMDILKKARQYEDAVHMEVGEPDVEPSPRVLEAMDKAVQDKKYHYTSACGLLSLRERIASHYASTYNVTVAPERVIVTPGTSGAFLIILGLLLDSGDTFCLSDPSYPCYKNFAYFLDAQPVCVHIGPDTNFEVTVDALKRVPDVKVLIVSSPSNPVGNLYREQTVKELLTYCHNHGIHFISDEIYHGLVYDKTEHTALEFSDTALVINGFSKSFCMPGFRIGWMIVPEEMGRQAEIAIQNLFISTNTPAQYAACEAFDSDYSQYVRRVFKERRDYLYAELSSLFSIQAHPDGAFYIWADISQYASDSVVFCRRLLEEEHVAITPGLDFGKNNTTTSVRFAYTRTIEELEEGVKRIKRFVKTL